MPAKAIRMGRAAACVGLILWLPGGSYAGPPRPKTVGDIFVVGADGGGRTNLTKTAAPEHSPSLSPDARRIAYVRSTGMRSEIWIMNADGSGQRRLTAGGEEEAAPVWSPDGRRLMYMTWDFGGCYPGATKCAVTDVWTIAGDGSGQRKLFDSALQPRWSPDGKKVLFQAFESNVSSTAIVVANADGAGARTVVPALLADAELAPPAWSPRGTRIAYGSGATSSGTRINVMRTDGRKRRRLTTGWNPVWSPDGTAIAFARGSGIWLVGPDGGAARRIAGEHVSPPPVPSLAWSPRGKRLAFSYGRGLYVVRADGRGRRLVAEGATCCHDVFLAAPAWSRDGRRIYYSG